MRWGLQNLLHNNIMQNQRFKGASGLAKPTAQKHNTKSTLQRSRCFAEMVKGHEKSSSIVKRHEKSSSMGTTWQSIAIDKGKS